MLMGYVRGQSVSAILAASVVAVKEHVRQNSDSEFQCRDVVDGSMVVAELMVASSTIAVGDGEERGRVLSCVV